MYRAKYNKIYVCKTQLLDGANTPLKQCLAKASTIQRAN